MTLHDLRKDVEQASRDHARQEAHAALVKWTENSSNASTMTWLAAQDTDDQGTANGVCHLVSVAIATAAAARDLCTDTDYAATGYARKELIRRIKSAEHNLHVAKLWLGVEEEEDAS